MKTLCRALIALSILLLFPSPPRADFQKMKIAVLDFNLQGDGNVSRDMEKIVAEWIITAFVKEGRFEVVERRLLQKVLNEQKLNSIAPNAAAPRPTFQRANSAKVPNGKKK